MFWNISKIEWIEAMAGKNKTFILALLVLSITAISLIGVVKNEFMVGWDDDIYVTSNENIRQISAKKIRNIFSDIYFYNYQPLTILSYAADHLIGGMSPRVFHVDNLILHLINCLLVYVFCFYLTKNRMITFIMALLFGIHPIHIEPVAWISGRKDLLFSLFFILTMVLYARYIKEKENRTIYYIFAQVAAVLSGFSKGTVLVLPGVLFLIDFLLKRKFTRSSIYDKTPFFVIAAAFGALAIYAQKLEQVKNNYFNLLDKILISGHNLGFYIYKTIYPVGISPFYPFPAKIENHLPVKFILTFLLFVIVASAVYILGKRQRIIVFGGLFYVATIFPFLQFVIIGGSLTADRFYYLPSLGPFMLISYLLTSLYERTKQIRIKYAMVIVFSLMIFALAWLSSGQAGKWKDSESLFGEVIKRYPDAMFAYNNIGNHFLRNGEADKAVEIFGKAISIKPSYADGHYNIGIAYLKMERFDSAMFHLEKAVDLDPKLYRAYYEIANIYLMKTDYIKAEEIFEKILRYDENDLTSMYNIAVLNERRGDKGKAIIYYRKVLELKRYDQLIEQKIQELSKK
jgi:tetratricopeptide (TPR) repeat protein